MQQTLEIFCEAVMQQKEAAQAAKESKHGQGKVITLIED